MLKRVVRINVQIRLFAVWRVVLSFYAILEPICHTKMMLMMQEFK